jgi:dephospho-CoA kinase
MIVLGLTGSIAMGKSTVATMLRRQRVPVFDADAEVHRLQAPGGAALPAIEAAFPGVTSAQGLDRQKLGAAVFGNPAALKRLEAILHPLVRASQLKFRRQNAMARRKLIVFDIPLLFEKGGWRMCDFTAVVSAPAYLQRQRVLRRPGMTAEKFAAILKSQMPDWQKRRRADFILPSGHGKAVTWRAVAAMLRSLKAKPQRA